MNNGTSSLPYSPEGLQALAETLKIHQSFLWIDPVSQSMRVKEVPDQRPQRSK